jgi:hypothetical protein
MKLAWKGIHVSEISNHEVVSNHSLFNVVYSQLITQGSLVKEHAVVIFVCLKLMSDI